MPLSTNVQLSKNFNMQEFMKTNTGLNNVPSWEEFQAVEDKLGDLVHNVLQPARDHFRKPVYISSGFRSEAVNNHPTVRGSSTSQHRLGEAADIEIRGVDNLELARWISKNTTFDQLILEDYNGAASSGWVHVSYRAGRNRKQILNAPNPRSGKFYPGLPKSKTEAVIVSTKENAKTQLPGLLGIFAGVGIAGLLFWKAKKK